MIIAMIVKSAANATPHQIVQNAYGDLVCDCGSFRFAQGAVSTKTCKHLKAIRRAVLTK